MRSAGDLALGTGPGLVLRDPLGVAAALWAHGVASVLTGTTTGEQLAVRVF